MTTRILATVVALVATTSSSFAQLELQPLIETERSFERSVTDNGMKIAFLEFLKDDGIIFEPGPINGKQFWQSRESDPSTEFVRTLTYSDIDANGMLGYTTGNWRTYQKGKSEGLAKFGQYVTIWE